MGRDFSKPYRGVQYFGIWAEETADDYGRRDAMQILCDVIDRCVDDDVRESTELAGAFAYLSGLGAPAGLLKGFRQALDMPHPLARQTCARASYKALAVALGRKPLGG